MTKPQFCNECVPEMGTTCLACHFDITEYTPDYVPDYVDDEIDTPVSKRTESKYNIVSNPQRRNIK